MNNCSIYTYMPPKHLHMVVWVYLTNIYTDLK
jgi:hypothetical protein